MMTAALMVVNLNKLVFTWILILCNWKFFQKLI